VGSSRGVPSVQGQSWPSPGVPTGMWTLSRGGRRQVTGDVGGTCDQQGLRACVSSSRGGRGVIAGRRECGAGHLCPSPGHFAAAGRSLHLRHTVGRVEGTWGHRCLQRPEGGRAPRSSPVHLSPVSWGQWRASSAPAGSPQGTRGFTGDGAVHIFGSRDVFSPSLTQSTNTK
jgi:hypothetical protein